ncbi:MAG: uracil-DNA glycosylase [Clostridia bacterium]|nr:uracil-DNA glycosylase [Clostridia bacterium]
MVDFGNDWNEVLKGEFDKDYYKILRGFLKHEYAAEKIHPDMYDIFNAFKATAYKDVKVVIIGQDPYHQPNQAHGMAFSVKKGVRLPPSLRNIYREISDDLGIEMGECGYLMPWAKQGVFLLNTILTVREGRPMSHHGYGWEIFTDEVLRKLNARKEPIIFLLWGAPAKKKRSLCISSQHTVLEAAHPSPLSAHYGFFGCKHFSTVNKILTERGEKPIDWQIR